MQKNEKWYFSDKEKSANKDALKTKTELDSTDFA